MTEHFSLKRLGENDSADLSDFARKLIEHSTQFHQERPAETLRTCVEMGMGRLQQEYGGGERVVQAALAEIAAKTIFAD